MNQLETLIFEFYEWQNYIVRKNVKVGKRSKGGWTMELDIVAYNPLTQHLVHIEPGIDANSWPERNERYEKKFSAGQQYIFTEVFPWLSKATHLEQVPVLVNKSASNPTVAGKNIETVDELMKRIRIKVAAEGPLSKAAIPESFPLLRTIQLLTNGYHNTIE